MEFSIRAINAGYLILVDPNNRVIHTYSLNERSKEPGTKLYVNERRFEHTFRSYFIYLYKNFNLIYFLKYSTKLVLSKFYVSFKLGFLFTYFKTLISLFILIYSVKDKRKPVLKKIQQKYNFGNLKFKDLYVYYSD